MGGQDAMDMVFGKSGDMSSKCGQADLGECGSLGGISCWRDTRPDIKTCAKCLCARCHKGRCPPSQYQKKLREVQSPWKVI